MTRRSAFSSVFVTTFVCWTLPAVAAPLAHLTRLTAPRITAASEDYPGGHFAAERLLDNDPKTEFASRGEGTDTFVEFDFGIPVQIAAFQHTDRNDPATIAASQLSFLTAEGRLLSTATVQHVNRSGGTTFLAFPQPVRAQRVRWRVTELGGRFSTVGGAEVAFFTSDRTDATPSRIDVNTHVVSIVERRPEGDVQPLEVLLDYPYATPIEAMVRVQGFPPKTTQLQFGTQTIRYTVPVVDTERAVNVDIEYAGQTVVTKRMILRPARRTTVYLLPHSHTDIGYTQLQTEIEDKQIQNLLTAIDYANKTASYPPEARFVWNVEVLWAADLYLQRLTDAQQTMLLDAIKSGQVKLCGMYLNELTGLCRPEELMRLFRFATELRQRTGVPIESAMISDVPGYTWGTVTALAQAGIKYFSVAPNYFDRMGNILVEWENKPFYWVGPSHADRVLVWIPYRGYATSHIVHALSPEFVEHYERQLDDSGYPYDVAYLRWAGHGDNAVPDMSICDFVRDWNAKYRWPRFVISGVTEAFRALEERYGDRLPRVRGDWTPYWEDGAGSSARETAMNRASSDRLIQAEALWAMQSAATYPSSEFEEAWRRVLLYSEHTWGAWCSVSEPNRRETREQWQIKQSYAFSADAKSRELLSHALAFGQQAKSESAIDVFNTTSWPRTDLVVIPKHLSEGRDRVMDQSGKPVPSQRLRSGELAILARRVPPLGARRYHLREGAPHVDGTLTVAHTALDNGLVRLRLDEQTGGIVELAMRGLDKNLVDVDSGQAVNDYLYFIGADPSHDQGSGPAKITVREQGPLVASLLVESDAPGCFRLQREVRLVAGLDYVELIDLVDKRRLRASSYHATDGKESVNFAFPFCVPSGQVRLHVPFGVMQPDRDQIPSACKNWFTVGRWADVSNDDFGVTWVTRDAPLVQVGGVTATLLNSQSNPAVWRKQVGPTQKLYAWAMNNHWGTNYRAYQEGPVVFRFILRPHRQFDASAASRLAIGQSQPLLPTGARGMSPGHTSYLSIDPPHVLLTGCKPSDDGQAVIVRLWESSGRDSQAKITRPAGSPGTVWLSDLSEQPRERLAGSVAIPAWGVVTLRVEPGD